MQEKHILEYIKGHLSPEERQHINDWIRSDINNQKKFNLLKAKHVASSFNEVSGDDSNVYYKKFSEEVKVKKNFKHLMVASSFLLITFFFINYFSSSEINTKAPNSLNDIIDNNIVNTITTKGGKSEIILPDGSKVILNADSKLSYPKIFNDSIRHVNLIGEALFDIEHDSSRPFIVDANEIKIKVLGTTFNVKSYSKDKKIETTLISGKVELIKDEGVPVELTPSQKGIFYKNKNKILIEEVNSSNIIAWNEGKLIFKNTSMSEVALDLERKYNVKFIINSQKLLDYEYTGTFDNLTINEVLDLLAISSPIKYSIQDEKVTLEMN